MDKSQLLLSDILSLGDWSTWKESLDEVDVCLKSLKNRTNWIRFQHVYLIGCGTSYYAGQVGKYLIEQIAHLPAEAIPSFSFIHHSASNLFSKESLVIGVSTTGETQATCDGLSFARQNGATTLAITAVPNSKIVGIAQHTIYTGENARVIVKTRNYIQTLIGLYLLALNLLEQGDPTDMGVRNYWINQFRLAHGVTAEFFDKQQLKISEIVGNYQSAENVFILGNGPNIGTAEEAALKVIEMTKMYSDGSDMEDFFHGRDREINEKSPIFFLAPGNQAQERMFDFLTFNQKVGVPSIVITTREVTEFKKLANYEVIMKGALDELATPLVYITPLYLFSYYLALKRGLAPTERRFPIGALSVRYRGSDYDET